MNDGGPAFPTITTEWDQHKHEHTLGATQSGMSLRDWFAGMALQGYMANTNRPTHFHPSEDANWCYTIADAMLEARK